MLSILYTVSRWYSSTMLRYFYSRNSPCTSVSNDLIRSKQKPKFTLKKRRWFTCGWTLQELEKTPKQNVLKRLTLFSPRLGNLYKRMIQKMSESDDAAVCRCVLTSCLHRNAPHLIQLYISGVCQ
ncbi:hypothetical protein COCMIDRAFT_86834 [Bipolaris oryzae ATCC 44560]|uniref:Uncharacterized protein n=1 Tax=Bipolaris oryzae ATCC 44560 TaxID=930090 RepID=W6ZA18_COCMI|nr:uncharacterized protein COCMIDRAFT_86834 [Bipolaris oryzae ATCC 44560]EUC48587.1 hypothetical protein COCMIDRAFT_86834 [Bipolaris oryzae ATCC 44560]